MTYVDLEHLHGTLTMDTTHVLTIAQIYHLKITEENVYVGALIEAVSLLPEFTTLKIHSLSLHKSILLNSEEVITHFSMNEIEEISFFFERMPLSGISQNGLYKTNGFEICSAIYFGKNKT
ncbi:unnamed protein product [Rotaria sp. Silwood2]|nr:unnamed protein product [Rotaria sp. Silwood2]